MHSTITFAEKTVEDGGERHALIHVFSGWGSGPHITLTGSTFPIVPIGTVVDKLFVNVPDGLQAVAFFCRVEEPRQVGSGKTAYLDHTPELSASLLLSWEEEGGKLIIKDDRTMSVPQLAKFNPFVRSDVDVFVVDSERKIVYVSDFLPRKAVDQAWTYKSVSMEAILQYITKKLALEQLDERAISEQRDRNELQNRNELQKLREDSYRDLAGALKKSEELYKCLKHLPVKIRPKAFDGYVEAMDLLNKPATT